MSVSTSATTNSRRPWHKARFHAAGWLLPGIVILWGTGRSWRMRTPLVSLIALLALTIFLLSCAGVSNGGGGGGGGSVCSSAPDVPAAPTASTPTALQGSTTVTTTLTWPAPAASSACTVTQYLVYENGSSTPLATVPTPTSGLQLTPGSYSFTVAAQDSFGTSAPSTALTVLISQITVTGTSPGAPPDSGQSTQVFLVVN